MDNCREYNFWLSSFSDVRCLRTFLALGNLELYFVAFLQTLIALRSDGAIMHKTSGPSSRPINPYPFALLNHLTVPFSRSTCSPSGRALLLRAHAPFSLHCDAIYRGESRLGVTEKIFIYADLETLPLLGQP